MACIYTMFQIVFTTTFAIIWQQHSWGYCGNSCRHQDRTTDHNNETPLFFFLFNTFFFYLLASMTTSTTITTASSHSSPPPPQPPTMMMMKVNEFSFIFNTVLLVLFFNLLAQWQHQSSQRICLHLNMSTMSLWLPPQSPPLFLQWQ